MIFMTCSTVTPGFGVMIVSTPVILGCGGVDWPCAMGARTVANASSRKDISIVDIVQLLLIPHGIWFLRGTGGYHAAGLDAREEKRLRPRIKIVVLYGTKTDKETVMAKASMSKRRQEGGDETAVRKRILDAAFAAFM